MVLIQQGNSINTKKTQIILNNTIQNDRDEIK